MHHQFTGKSTAAAMPAVLSVPGLPTGTEMGSTRPGDAFRSGRKGKAGEQGFDLQQGQMGSK